MTNEFLTRCDDVERTILSSRKPKANLIFNCRGCDLFGDCTGKNDEHHIFELPYFREHQLTAFSEEGIIEVSEIPDDFGLPRNQEIVRRAVSENQHIVENSLEDSLDEIEFPAYYLDFETVNTALPLYPNTAPYTQIPTQYSIHKCSKIGQVANHYECLAWTNSGRMKKDSIKTAMAGILPAFILNLFLLLPLAPLFF